MDRKELENKLKTSFKDACQNAGYPLQEICLEEAYPGDDSTSYMVRVVASWVKDMNCNSALDVLIDLLWDSVEENYRRYIFSIKIFADSDTFHCFEPNVGDRVNRGSTEYV